MEKARFELALERLKYTEWAKFEDLVREFLAPEFPTLRSTASPSGDLGRDAELFMPDNDPSIVIQISVTEGWSPKIKATAKRISKTLENARVLIYVTNQIIGAKADILKKELRQEYSLILDIRDRTWFIDRFRIDAHREKVAEELAKQIVDPYLQSKDIISSKSTALSGAESQTALIYLELQWEDDTRDKGLTKVCFEALVRSALRNTDSNNRLERDEILSRVRSFLPTHQAEKVDQLTNGALARLAKKSIRLWTKEDEFCLSHEEKLRLIERLSKWEYDDEIFLKEIQRRLDDKTEHLDAITDELKTSLINLIRTTTERFLFARGEVFARSIQDEQFEHLSLHLIRDFAVEELGKISLEIPDWVQIEFVEDFIIELLARPGPEVMPRLKRLADSYSLMAFLRETPDVQSAVSKMFSHGEIWLDTSLLLPLLAEELLEPSERSFENMVAAAREAAVKLYVTPGVIEEVCAHINRCNAYQHNRDRWVGRVPFLYTAHAINATHGSHFASWIERFVGDLRPAEDIAEYLQDEFGINVMSLVDEVEKADSDLRYAIKEEWIAVHENRRQREKQNHDEHLTLRLAEHDTENYLGVMQRRSGVAGTSPFGHAAWWLTMDSAARPIHDQITKRLNNKPPESPVMSPDFLVNYLAFGPVRRQVSKHTGTALPLILGHQLAEELPTELIEQFERIREDNKELPDRVVKRRIRDALDAARRRKGTIVRGGIHAVQQRFGV